MSANVPFLGTGWSFPPTFIRDKNSVEMVSDETDINQSLNILLSTSITERILQPTYGCDLEKLLFEPIDTALKAYMKDLIKTAILYHEPRIRLDNIFLEEKQNEGMIEITLEYTIRITNSRYNFVYPFYLNEGSGASQ